MFKTCLRSLAQLLDPFACGAQILLQRPNMLEIQADTKSHRKKILQLGLGSTLGIHCSKTTEQICLFSNDLLVYLNALM